METAESTRSTAPEVIRSRDLDDARVRLSRLFSPHGLAVDGRGGTLDVQVTAWKSEELTVARVRHGCAVEVTPGRLHSYYNINVPLRGYSTTRNGETVVESHRGRGAVLNPTFDTVMSWSPDCEQLAVKIDRSLIDRSLEAVLGRPVDRAVVFDTGWDLTRGVGEAWVRTIELLRESLASGAPAIVVRPLEELAVAQLLTGNNHSFRGLMEGEPPPPRLRSLSRVMELVDADPAAPLTVADMARIAGTSVRALQAAFSERLGITPTEYLRQARLARVHEELVQAEPDEKTTVSEVASRWGFTHLPRFAAAYREKYGETPSRTLGTR